MEAKENLQNGGSTFFSVHGWPGRMNKMNSNTNKILGLYVGLRLHNTVGGDNYQLLCLNPSR
jgi:hypothetical protein